MDFWERWHNRKKGEGYKFGCPGLGSVACSLGPWEGPLSLLCLGFLFHPMETVFLSISNMVIRGCREVLDTQIQDHSSSYWDYWQESWCPSKHSIHTRVRWAQPTSKESVPPHRTFHGPSPSDDAVQPFTTTESRDHPYTE